MQPECAVLPMIVESAFDDRSTTLADTGSAQSVSAQSDSAPAIVSLTESAAAPIKRAEQTGADHVRAEQVRLLLAELLGAKQFENWYPHQARLSVAGDTLVVTSANPFLLKWLQKQHRTALSRAAHSVLGPSALLKFEADAAVPTTADDTAGRTGESHRRSRAIPTTPAPPAADETPPPAELRTASPAPAPGRRFMDLSDFVVGPCNQLARTAALQASAAPCGAGGPVYLYGPVGCGKTHLLEGMYREIRRRHPALNVVFLTSEQFTNHFTMHLRKSTLASFRQRFRTVDVLLVDDIDFLDAKRVVQEEFLHTLQELESQGRQVILCGERHPRLLAKISDELRTRFLSGVICRIELPDLETRERIAVAKAQRLGADISPEAVKYVARKFRNSVRELEGALHCLQNYHRMTGQRVGVTAARSVLGDLERDCLRVVRLSDIEKVVCDLFKVEAEELKSSRRVRALSVPRMLAMFLARRHTRAAYSEIGAYFGGRNHATVIAADHKIADGLSQNLEIRVASQDWRLTDLVDTLEQQLQAG